MGYYYKCTTTISSIQASGAMARGGDCSARMSRDTANSRFFNHSSSPFIRWTILPRIPCPPSDPGRHPPGEQPVAPTGLGVSAPRRFVTPATSLGKAWRRSVGFGVLVGRPAHNGYSARPGGPCNFASHRRQFQHANHHQHQRRQLGHERCRPFPGSHHGMGLTPPVPCAYAACAPLL